MTNRIIGYMRVSTTNQDETLQMDALKKYAEQEGKKLVLYKEKVSSRK